MQQPQIEPDDDDHLGRHGVGVAAGGLIQGECADPAMQKLFAGYVWLGSMIFLG